MTSRRPDPPLRAGFEAEWAEVNREEEEQMHREDTALTPSQRLEVGQKLSEQAVEILAASIRSGHVPRRAYWS